MAKVLNRAYIWDQKINIYCKTYTLSISTPVLLRDWRIKSSSCRYNCQTQNVAGKCNLLNLTRGSHKHEIMETSFYQITNEENNCKTVILPALFPCYKRQTQTKMTGKKNIIKYATKQAIVTHHQMTQTLNFALFVLNVQKMKTETLAASLLLTHSFDYNDMSLVVMGCKNTVVEAAAAAENEFFRYTRMKKWNQLQQSQTHLHFHMTMRMLR